MINYMTPIEEETSRKKDIFEVFMSQKNLIHILLKLYLSKDVFIFQLVRNLNLSPSCVTHQIAYLRKLNLLKTKKDGRKKKIVLSEEGKNIAQKLYEIRQELENGN